MIGIDSKHYPETLGRMFIINVPTIFSVPWAILKPFLDERTQRKIEVFSSVSAWKKRLREVVEPRDLPVDFGGELPVQVCPGSRTRKTNVAAGASFSDATFFDGLQVRAQEEVREPVRERAVLLALLSLLLYLLLY